jgi:hypothetical protein
VTLTNGFDKTDNLLIAVSESDWSRQLFFNALPNRDTASSTILPMTNGNYTLCISEQWREIYNSPLPTSIYLQILNIDTDGIANFAYVDMVELRVNSPSTRGIQFWEDFKGSTLYCSGWHTDYNGSGSGTAVVNGEGLELHSQRSNGTYWFSIHKPFQLLENSSSVKLRFQLEATEGFSYRDAFAIVISDSEWNRQIRLSTNPGVILTTCWIQPTGTQEIRLGEIWNNTFHDVLPKKLYVQIISVDGDGVENVAYVGLVEFVMSLSDSGSENH